MDLYAIGKGLKRAYDGYSARKRGRYQYAQASKFYGSANAYAGRNNRYRRRARRAFRSANWQWGGFLGIEKKFYDCALANAAIVQNANFTGCFLDPTAIPGPTQCLNAPAQGAGANTRVGIKYNIISIWIGGQVFVQPVANQATAPAASTIFWALVMDKQTNGAQAATELIYQNPSATLFGASLAPVRNMQYSKRFKVLKTWNTVLTPNFSGDGVANQEDVAAAAMPFEYFKKFKKPIRVECIASTGTVADIMNYSFHLVGTANGGAPLITYNCRIRFTDP